MNFSEWKQTEAGKQAAADADRMTKDEKIREIMRIIMKLSGVPDDAIREYLERGATDRA